MRNSISALALGAVLALSLAGAAFAQSNGSGTDMQAYYDCEVHTINFKQVSLSSTHSQINNIYVFPQCPTFLMVIDQITGGEVAPGVPPPPPPKNGFNPLWRLVNVYFNSGNCPTDQSGFCSDSTITTSNEVTLVPSNPPVVFRCSVVGQKSPNGP